MKYLLQAIDARRDCVRLSDHELRDLLIEVRSGKDDRIEFTESMVRLLEELKSSEHATAFLTKVAKRDAPDYYDVIKNPMDLGTMLRNVRQGRYKSKAQFMRDLDLIWDNCLTYNSEPTHPLRRSVQVLRAKANHLLTYVNDTNDVKEALNQWQASLGLPRPSADATIVGSNNLTDIGADQGSKTKSGLGMSILNATSLIDTPFEQRPAILRTADGMSTFTDLDSSLSHLDKEFADRYLNAEAGPSSHTLDSPSYHEGSLLKTVDILKTLEGAQKGILSSALAEATSSKSTSEQQKDNSKSNPNEDTSDAEEENEQIEDSIQARWWNSMAHPSMLAAGATKLNSSEQTNNRRIEYIGGRPAKKRRNVENVENNTVPSGSPENNRLMGASKAVERNVRTITKLRRTHLKYGRLNSHIESGEPIPADLGVMSSDDDEEDVDKFSKQNKGPTKKPRRKAPDALMIPVQEMAGNPYPGLSGEGASELLSNRTNLLLAHAGFDGSHKSAADVMVDVAGEFLMNVGRTLRSYSDRFAHEMSVEELILHTLFENGGLDVRSLESYVADDVVRYGNKMSELLRKLRASYRDTLANTDLTMADEAAYFGSSTIKGDRQGMVNGNAEGEEDEHILRGGLGVGLADDDFFGFKDLGLDEELGMDVGRQLASMPSRVFSRRDQDGGPGGVGAKGRLGGSGSSGASMLDFEPPPPFIPLTEAAISAQIGILRPFYRELLRSRGQWQRTVQEQEQEQEQENMFADVENANDKDAYLILPDEEQERQRYRVPPTGKMLRRPMKKRLTESNKSIEKAKNSSALAARKPVVTTKASSNSLTNGNLSNSDKLSKKSKSKKKDATSKQNGKPQHSTPVVTVS